MDTLEARVCDRARLARDARFDGRFFIGVVSTGIYCRAICPSPVARRQNVRYFRSAAEAVEAGFRPCLRCRPEAAPGTPALERHLDYGEPGSAIDRRRGAAGAGVAALAERLGVSARHLDRLFRVHLGASPIAVARAWRLHFAKQLISDTDLPMFRVAMASGFRSVRRFNDSIRELYGRTPSELRRLRPVALRARQDDYVFRLPYRPPYDWESLLAFFAGRAIPGVEEVVAGAYRRSFTLQGRHGVLEVRHEESANALEARIRFAEPVSLLPIVTRLRGMFDLAADPSVIAEHFRRDPCWDAWSGSIPACESRARGTASSWPCARFSASRCRWPPLRRSPAGSRPELGEPLSVPDRAAPSCFRRPRRSRREPRRSAACRASAIRSLAQAVASGRVASPPPASRRRRSRA